MSKKKIIHDQFECVGSENANELALAFLHAGFTVHMPTYSTCVEIHCIVCVDKEVDESRDN